MFKQSRNIGLTKGGSFTADAQKYKNSGKETTSDMTQETKELGYLEIIQRRGYDKG